MLRHKGDRRTNLNRGDSGQYGIYMGRGVSEKEQSGSPSAVSRRDGITLYRGIHKGSKEPQELERLHSSPQLLVPRRAGIHWSTDLSVAYGFAFGGPAPDRIRRYNRKADLWSVGVILTAHVAREHIVEPYSTEWEALMDRHSIRPPDFGGEDEVTVRRGAPVQIVGVEVVSDVPGESDVPEERRTPVSVALERKA